MDLSRTALFLVGWLAYASIFIIRKPMSLIKADLDFDAEFSALQLGMLDFAFLLPFSLGQIFLGYLGDRKNSRQILTVSLLISSVPLAIFPLGSFTFLFVMLMILGVCQAPCWSLISRVLSQRFSPEYRNTVLGVLTSASFIGGITGTILTVYVQYTIGWTKVYIIPAILNVLIGLVAFVCFKESPDLDKSSPVLNNRYSSFSPSLGSAIEFCSNRSIFVISLSIFIVRLVRFTMYMWVPYFLLDEILYAQLDSGLISVAFEGGGIFGSLVFGLLVDKFFSRRAVMCVLICNVLTAVSIKFFHMYCYHVVHAILWLAIIGFFNCAADSLLSGSIPTEIGESLGAPGSVVGFVNGIGTLGAVVEGPFFSFLLMRFGWDTAFLLCIILSGVVSTLPLLFYPGIFSFGSSKPTGR